MASTGVGGASAKWHDFAEFVCRALHDAVKHIEPQADGLEPIRARILAWSGSRDHQAAQRRRLPGAGPRARNAGRGRPGPGPRRRRS